jgi:hypothetical protein
MMSGSLARALSTAIAGAIHCTAQAPWHRGINLSVIEELTTVGMVSSDSTPLMAKVGGKLDLKGQRGASMISPADS